MPPVEGCETCKLHMPTEGEEAHGAQLSHPTDVTTGQETLLQDSAPRNCAVHYMS